MQSNHNIAYKWYQSLNLQRLFVEIPKRGGLVNQDSNTAIQEIMPKIEAVTTSIFLLTSTKYRLWAMRMEVYLEAHELWEVVTGTETNRKKDWQALRINKFSNGCKKNCKRELENNSDTPCGSLSHCKIKNTIAAMRV